MARELWVQVSVEMPTDSKLYARSLLDRHLWTCLLCLAKKQGTNGLIIGYTPMLLEKHFNIGSLSKVVMALNYFVAAGMIEMRENGDIFLIHFAARQALSKAQAHAVRQARYRDKHSVTNGVTTSDTESDNDDVTSDGEEEEEEEERDPLTPQAGDSDLRSETAKTRASGLNPRALGTNPRALAVKHAAELRANAMAEQQRKAAELDSIPRSKPPPGLLASLKGQS